jgi:hypothetical protein
VVSESFGCSWISSKLFPWKSLPKKLAESGVIVQGWPDGVLSLGEERTVNSSGKPTRPKGISNLTLSEAGKIMSAFQDPSPNRLRCEYHPEWRGMSSLLTYIINLSAYVYFLSCAFDEEATSYLWSPSSTRLSLKTCKTNVHGWNL